MESDFNRRLSFLDFALNVRNNKIITDWFHKTIFSGRYLSFYSNHPICHEVGFIYSLVDCATKLSHPSFHEKNLIYKYVT